MTSFSAASYYTCCHVHNIVTALIPNVFLLMLYSVLEERSTLSAVLHVLVHAIGLILIIVLINAYQVTIFNCYF